MERRATELLDPPEPDAVIVPELVAADPAALINIDRVLQSSEGVTGQDVAEAVVLEQQALSVRTIDDDAIEEHVGELIDQLTTVDQRIEGKGRAWCDLAFRLHRGLTGLFGANGQTRQHTQNGLRHLRPLLASRLEAKRRAEEQRQREARETALREEQDRKLQEAAHLETVGAPAEEVQQVLLEAETLPPPPVAAQPITNIRGASVRENWKCEITSKAELVKFVAANPQFLTLVDVNQTAANQLAKAQKSGLKLPGLRAFNDVVLTKRRA